MPFNLKRSAVTLRKFHQPKNRHIKLIYFEMSQQLCLEALFTNNDNLTFNSVIS